MSLTLYRKYRPKKFAEISGQEHIVRTLLNQLESGKIAQAYLFTGPRGVGKTTTARLFAAAIDSPAGGEPAQEILEGRDLDVIEIDAASNSGVDHVREYIIENARLTPNRRPYKIFIIDEVHMLSGSAFNALLKLIEEPPKHALFILATTELHKVPATIVSRCQRFDFRKLGTPQIIARLADLAKREGVEVEDSILLTIAKRADGSLRDAESILGQILALGGKNISAAQAEGVMPSSMDSQALELLNLLAGGDAPKAMSLINNLTEGGADLNQFALDFLGMAREVMLCQHGLANNLPDQFAAAVAGLAAKMKPADTIRVIETFAEHRLQLKNSLIAQLPLELAVMKFLTSTERPLLPAVKTSEAASELKTFNSAAIPVVQEKISEVKITPQVPPPAKEVPRVIASVPTSKPAEAGDTALITKIKQDWAKFLTLLQQDNASLVLIMKTVEPLRISGDTLIIGFKYPFHKERVNSHDSRQLLEERLSQFFKSPLRVAGEVLAADYHSAFIEAQTNGDEIELVSDTNSGQNATLFVEKNQAEPAMSQDNLIQNLIKAFGGRVVE